MGRISNRGVSEVIVVGVDGSENSERAFDVALAIAQKRQYALKVVSAYSEPGYKHIPDSAYGLAQKQARHDVEELITKVDEPDVRIDTEVIEGDAAGILTYESREASLVVVGKRGRSRFSGRLLGSVSASVAAHSYCPSLVVPQERAIEELPEAKYAKLPAHADGTEIGVVTSHEVEAVTDFSGNVVVGADVGAYPVETALHGAQYADEYGFDLVLATAQPFSGRRWTPFHPAYLGAVPDMRKEAAAELAEIADRVARRTSAQVQWRFFDAYAADILAAASRAAELVVVGTRGRGGFAGLLLGSVSQAVLNRAVSPVLVVPTKR